MANVKFYAPTSSEVSERERTHMEQVRRLAAECMVLLENDGTLPLKASSGSRIALYGDGVRHTVKGGTGSGEVNSRVVINIEQAFEEAGFTVTTKDWLDAYDRRMEEAIEAYQEELEKVAAEKGESAAVLFYLSNPFRRPQVQSITMEDIEKSDTDLAVYVLGRSSGEGRDRTPTEGDYLLSKEEKEAIRRIAESYDRCIVLLNVGGVVDTTELKDIPGVNAIMFVGQAGNIAGYAVVDALLGKTIPSGKLASTWAGSYSDYPSWDTFSHMNGNLDDEYYTEGIYVGYRWFDTFNITPNYCFGYGLSYTTFSLKTLDVTADEEQVTARVEVVNTGQLYPGREVVQIYYSAPEGKLEKPYQELAAFAKTKLLAPGESEVLTISFPTKSMASYSEEEAAWVLEAGTYYIRVGNHSRNTTVEAAIHLAETVKTVQLENKFQDDHEWKEISAKGVAPYSYETERAEKERARKITLDPSRFSCETVTYQQERPVYQDERPGEKITLEDVRNNRATLEQLVAQLTVEEMAELCVGTSSGGDTIVGASAVSVPGASGQTRSLEDRKISGLVLADGPAGLRLQPHFRATRDGRLLPGGHTFGFRTIPMPEEKPEDAIDYYQYCTAIPVASLLAQSWDLELIEQIGRIIGREMEEFNVHLWLAPGMNIHRNPLCGRNFEYFSEDPLLSGKCAAAATRGVQSYPGRGTTLKHFAANNQEDNRMFTNAHVSERALREIYLKGFEIAVKESKPLSIMTSYNLINGTHAANHYDLIQSAARDEWGFDGVIVTDWYATDRLRGVGERKYPNSSSPLCIKAGNDLQMPGSQQNIDDIIAAVKGEDKEHPITLGDLQFCTLNILRVVLRIQQA